MKPQKALHLYQQLEKKNPKLEGKTYIAFEKYDGWYGYWDVGQQIMSRQMREIPSMKSHSDELNTYADRLPKGRFIFEILVAGSPVFKDLNGILNRHEQAKKAYLIAHDFIPQGMEGLPFHTRRSMMYSAIGQLPCHLLVAAQMLTAPMKFDADYWQDLANVIWREGGEGVIIKDANAPYSPGKRNADILKIKLENTEEMVVSGVHIGQGKYSKTLGYLLVKDVHGVTHKVSGMTDDERDTWWNDPELIIGKVVEVQFMQRLANGSLREPRFKAVRHDKTVKELG